MTRKTTQPLSPCCGAVINYYDHRKENGGNNIHFFCKKCGGKLNSNAEPLYCYTKAEILEIAHDLIVMPFDDVIKKYPGK